MVIGGEESDQANDTSKGDFDKSFSIKPKPPPGRRRIQISKISHHPKQPSHASSHPTDVPALLAGGAVVRRLLAESHVDRSIEGQATYDSTSSPDCVYIERNVSRAAGQAQSAPHAQAKLRPRTVAWLCRYRIINLFPVIPSAGWLPVGRS